MMSGIIEYVRDITRQRQAEQALLESEKHYRLLVETISDWTWAIDENAVYTYVSPRVRDLLGYEPEEVLGKTPFDFMPPEEACLVEGIFKAISALRKPLNLLENMKLHKDGHTVVLETSGVPLFDKDGTFLGYQGIDRDITERKSSEEKLRESEIECKGRVRYTPPNQASP